jgi:anthranilate phosphoribosyltransferase
LITYLKKIVSGENLTENEAFECMQEMISGQASDIQMAALLAALATKGETVEEITGFAQAMRLACTSLNISEDFNLVDTCGTGGDRLKTFNVSTAAAIIASSVGVNVAKHGNRAVTSSCGGADILESVGVKIDAPPEIVVRCLEKAGIGFIFAPNFHPATRNVMPVRQALGIRTVFNILGPLTSPAGAKIQLLGVFDPKYVEIMVSVLNNLGVERAMVVHGFDQDGNPGMDEISNVGSTLVAFIDKGEIEIRKMNPEDFGIKKSSTDLIKSPDTLEENLEIFLGVLNGKNQSDQEKARLEIALANAGAIIYLDGKASTIVEGTKIAQQAVKSGKAMEKLKEFIEISNSH